MPHFCLVDLDESIWKFPIKFGETESLIFQYTKPDTYHPIRLFSLAVVTVQHQGQKTLSFRGFSMDNVSTQRVHYLCPASRVGFR